MATEPSNIPDRKQNVPVYSNFAPNFSTIIDPLLLVSITDTGVNVDTGPGNFDHLKDLRSPIVTDSFTTIQSNGSGVIIGASGLLDMTSYIFSTPPLLKINKQKYTLNPDSTLYFGGKTRINGSEYGGGLVLQGKKSAPNSIEPIGFFSSVATENISVEFKCAQRSTSSVSMVKRLNIFPDFLKELYLGGTFGIVNGIHIPLGMLTFANMYSSAFVASVPRKINFTDDIVEDMFYNSKQMIGINSIKSKYYRFNDYIKSLFYRVSTTAKNGVGIFEVGSSVFLGDDLKSYGIGVEGRQAVYEDENLKLSAVSNVNFDSQNIVIGNIDWYSMTVGLENQILTHYGRLGFGMYATLKQDSVSKVFASVGISFES